MRSRVRIRPDGIPEIRRRSPAAALTRDVLAVTILLFGWAATTAAIVTALVAAPVGATAMVALVTSAWGLGSIRTRGAARRAPAVPARPPPAAA